MFSQGVSDAWAFIIPLRGLLANFLCFLLRVVTKTCRLLFLRLAPETSLGTSSRATPCQRSEPGQAWRGPSQPQGVGAELYVHTPLHSAPWQHVVWQTNAILLNAHAVTETQGQLCVSNFENGVSHTALDENRSLLKLGIR